VAFRGFDKPGCVAMRGIGAERERHGYLLRRGPANYQGFLHSKNDHIQPAQQSAPFNDSVQRPSCISPTRQSLVDVCSGAANNGGFISLWRATIEFLEGDIPTIGGMEHEILPTEAIHPGASPPRPRVARKSIAARANDRTGSHARIVHEPRPTSGGHEP
jgi:hypothetical protein